MLRLPALAFASNVKIFDGATRYITKRNTVEVHTFWPRYRDRSSNPIAMTTTSTGNLLVLSDVLPNPNCDYLLQGIALQTSDSIRDLGVIHG